MKPADSPTEVDRLLGAAEVVLARAGYEGMRVDDVLAEAGLSTRALYRHFHGKSELFLALFDRETARAEDRLRSRIGAAPDPDGAVRAWIEATLALAFDARLARRARLFSLEQPVMARSFPDEIRRCVASRRAPLEEAIAAGRDAGVFPRADPVADAQAIDHLCSGLLSDRLLGLDTMTRDHAVALATGFALQTLHADGRGRRAPAQRVSSR